MYPWLKILQMLSNLSWIERADGETELYEIPSQLNQFTRWFTVLNRSNQHTLMTPAAQNSENTTNTNVYNSRFYKQLQMFH